MKVRPSREVVGEAGRRALRELCNVAPAGGPFLVVLGVLDWRTGAHIYSGGNTAPDAFARVCRQLAEYYERDDFKHPPTMLEPPEVVD